MSDIKHTYSFTAVFEDGTVIEHDHNDENGDTSLTVEGGNRFTDVMEKSKESDLVSFVIHNDEQSLGVDLRDGHFELNSIPFWQHRPELTTYKDFRIVYYRTVQRILNQVTTEEIDAQVLGYTVGWQVTHDGKNVQRFVVV